ncbi:Uncharacterised protein [BD1-7 clade bacterium]|uniref:Lipoprotein n=1 Tax=BD1-7 clade bacterium TaxID=2029982 RepID=A0A5S9P785_9GAMM|nr:Uncharacterised protein [BD1-7 clade bacterium]
MNKKLLAAAIVSTGLIAGCGTLVNDYDTLSVNGFVVPAGETVLGDPRKDANPADSKAPEEKISEAKQVVDKNRDRLIMILHAEGDVIAQQTLRKPDTWPTAYQLKFSPPDIPKGKELYLELRTVKNDETLLVYSKKIELGDLVLFDTFKDVVITQHEKNLDLQGADEYFAMELDAELASALDGISNEDLNKFIDEEGYPQHEKPEGANSVFDKFECEKNKQVDIYFAENFAVLEKPRKVLPRLTGTPQTVYGTAEWKLVLNEEVTQFDFQAKDKKSLTCALKTDSYRPNVDLMDAERAPAPRDEKSGS